MMKMKLLAAVLAGGLTMSSVAETVVAGKAVRDVFPDERVVNLVSRTSSADFAVAEQQLRNGADVNIIGADGLTPLLWVLGTTRDVRKIEFLLKAGADPNYRDAKRQISPMYLAAGGSRPDILELLLKYKGNPNLEGPRGETLLMVAVSQFRDKNLDILIHHGADINQADRHRETVANKAASFGRYDLIARLLELGLTHDLQDLAKDVEITKVPAESEQQRWKNKVIDMLKARGVTFPAVSPK